MTVEQMADDDYFAFDAVDQTALKKYLGACWCAPR